MDPNNNMSALVNAEEAKWPDLMATPSLISISRWLLYGLTHRGRVTHICVNKLTIIGWKIGLSHGRGQVTIGTSSAILVIGSLGTNFSEILIEISTFSFRKRHFKRTPGKWRPFRLGLIVLNARHSISFGSFKQYVKAGWFPVWGLDCLQSNGRHVVAYLRQFSVCSHRFNLTTTTKHKSSAQLFL